MGHEGIIASPIDYLLFLEDLVDGEILSENTMEAMKTFHSSEASELSLGLGLERWTTPSGPVFGHTGGGFGTMTLLLYEPETKTSFFVGSNLGSIFDSTASRLFYEELLNDLVAILKNRE
jgi:D-alanyl-D-alanine carboxypeptidase